MKTNISNTYEYGIFNFDKSLDDFLLFMCKGNKDLCEKTKYKSKEAIKIIIHNSLWIEDLAGEVDNK